MKSTYPFFIINSTPKMNNTVYDFFEISRTLTTFRTSVSNVLYSTVQTYISIKNTMVIFYWSLFISYITTLRTRIIRFIPSLIYIPIAGINNVRYSQNKEIPDNSEICSPCKKINEQNTMSVFSIKSDKTELLIEGIDRFLDPQLLFHFEVGGGD